MGLDSGKKPIFRAAKSRISRSVMSADVGSAISERNFRVFLTNCLRLSLSIKGRSKGS